MDGERQILVSHVSFPQLKLAGPFRYNDGGMIGRYEERYDGNDIIVAWK